MKLRPRTTGCSVSMPNITRLSPNPCPPSRAQTPSTSVASEAPASAASAIQRLVVRSVSGSVAMPPLWQAGRGTGSLSQQEPTGSSSSTLLPCAPPLRGSHHMPSSSPRLLPMAKESETFAGVTYHIDGELVPVLTVDVTPDQPVFFEHHILLWKHPTVEIRLRPMKGALKRMIAGMQVFVTEAAGSGQVGFSRDAAGHVFAIHLANGEEIQV